MTTARMSHKSVTLPDGNILVLGGNERGSFAEVYDYRTNSFSAVTHPKLGRSLWTFKVLLPSGELWSGAKYTEEKMNGGTILYDTRTGASKDHVTLSMQRVLALALLY